MRKMLALQITALLIVSGTLGGMFFVTDVYDEVRSRIVSVLCLSCIKLEPKTTQNFTFDTADNAPHPNLVLENLTKGPVFLHYSQDICAACEVMFPIVKQIFNVEFEKQDMFWKKVAFDTSNITYIYINLDHTHKFLGDAFPVYDKDDIGGLPMFVVVTLGYDHGVIRPYYTTLYGTLNVQTDNERATMLTEILQESIELYKQNKEGYHIH
jgi:hypothetical protein